MEEKLKMLSQQSIDAMNAEANDDNYEIASVGVSYERNISYWERWGGWYALFAGNIVADITLDIAKALGAKGAVAFIITSFITVAAFVAAALWYYKWFDNILKRTYIVNLIKRRKRNVKKESEKVSESESNS